jgi:cytochrome P450
LAPQIRRIVRARWDAALEKQSFDFVTDFAAPVPCDVICEFLGVPPEDRPEIRRLTDVLVNREDGREGTTPLMVEAALTLVSYYGDLLNERAANPRQDYISALLAAADTNPGGTTRDDLIGVVGLLSATGIETTTHLLANAWHAAWQHPDQRRAVLAGRVPEWVEETLRYDPPSQGIVRTLTREVHLHGRNIPEDARVLLLVGSANRDPQVFSEPDRFDLDRDTHGLLTFGLGPHYCIGTSLARLEARIALEEITRTIREYDLDVEGSIRVPFAHIRGFVSLPTTIVPA